MFQSGLCLAQPFQLRFYQLMLPQVRAHEALPEFSMVWDPEMEEFVDDHVILETVQNFTVGGADSNYTWDILTPDTLVKVTDEAEYGTWAKASPVSDDATNTFTPADITAAKTFYLTSLW